MIKAIIFDIGGILYTGKREDFYNKLQTLLNIEDNKLTNLIEKHFDNLLLGKKSFFDLADDLKISKKDFRTKAKKAWLEVFIVKEEMINLINKLRKKYTIACLSNAVDFDVMMDKETKVVNLFDVYINSCDTKSRKPEKKIYQITLDQLNIKAEECIFIDDREKYLPTARKMGIKVIHFKKIKQLKEELVELGTTLKY
ncbi:HAD family phosphatase [archaeon]|jgi:2-haloacid dehalogenase|nr:HAD family phosphatase [archaeon]MBT3451097.1 HAD family phosphatase [archaeon]MBT6868659.1 HAD family phosphatase [archaeon]MBT7193374.1 HAD family phosphatase [archaeon]MBT7381456.1 HAD family phosphatase [archaeon]